MAVNNGVFITGIGTDVGKTVACAILVKVLGADYWKPVQAGNDTDSDTVKSLVENSPSSVFHPERYMLSAPLSPHAAAKIDNVHISLSDFALPKTDNFLVIEGAGGLMVPLNEQHTVADLIAHLKLPAIVVSKNYLGSINHSLLTIEALKTRQIPILGILFNGTSTPESENVITSISEIPSLGRIEESSLIDTNFITQQAARLKDKLYEFIRSRS